MCLLVLKGTGVFCFFYTSCLCFRVVSSGPFVAAGPKAQIKNGRDVTDQFVPV